MASEKYDAVPTVETSSHPQCSNWLRPWLQNQSASRSEKALVRGQTLRSNQPRTWNEVSNRHHICDRHSDLSDCFAVCAAHCILQHRATKLCTTAILWKPLFVFGNVCLKQHAKQEKWNETSTSVSHSVPLSNANSTLLRSMLDCNQNVSCQLSVVKCCFSIVDLIKFCVNLASTCWKFGVEICWKTNRIGNKLQCLPNWNTILVLTPSLAQPHQSLMPHVKTLQKIHCLRSGPNGISFWKLKRTWVCMFEVTTNRIDDLIPLLVLFSDWVLIEIAKRTSTSTRSRCMNMHPRWTWRVLPLSDANSYTTQCSRTLHLSNYTNVWDLWNFTNLSQVRVFRTTQFHNRNRRTLSQHLLQHAQLTKFCQLSC